MIIQSNSFVTTVQDTGNRVPLNDHCLVEYTPKTRYGPVLWQNYVSYPEWPHRQRVGLAFWSRRFAADSVQQVLWFAARIVVCNTCSSGGTALCRVGRATSQLDLPSLTPLSVGGCGWLQLGAPHWATSVITASSW